MRIARLFAGCLLCSSVVSATVGAQTATFSGGVARDTLNHGVSGVLIALIGLGRSDTSDAKGEFKFTGLPPGPAIVTVRKLGFQSITDTVMLTADGSIEREYVLDATATTLSSVTTTASSMASSPAGSSSHKRRFEEHVGRATGGRFLSDSALLRNSTRSLPDVLVSLFPGLKIYQPDPVNQRSTEYVGSSRSSCDGPAFSCGNGSPCPVTLYVDGAMTFNPSSGRLVAATRLAPPVDAVNGAKPTIDRPLEIFPDIRGIAVRDLVGIEFYAGGSTAPSEYSVTTTCGLLALWTRDK